MPVFEYKGVTESGKPAKGVIDADNPKSARLRLKQKGVLTTDLKERSAKKQEKGAKGSASSSTKVKLAILTAMTRQLATLVKARIPLDEALSALVEQTDDTKLKTIMSQVRVSVNEGKSLADACKQFPRTFSPIFVSMIQVGEASGNLDVVLNRLANFAEAQQDMRTKIVGAMAYPILMAIVGTAITLFLFAFAVPKITEVFAGTKVALPTLTVIMIGISDFITKNWFLLLLAVAGTISLINWYINTKKGREWWDKFSLGIPIFGKVKRMVAVSRFARTLSTMIGSGVQVLDAIDIVKDVVDNAVIRRALIQSRESISEGKTIAGPLKASGQFPPILTHMIAIGEKTGELEEMLNVVSDAYDSQVDTAIKSMTSLIGPIMLLVMGVIVFLVVLSILLPMMQMTNLAGTT